MAEKTKYPQIPSTVWWGVRSILNRTPTATLDERFLGVQLGVQEVAAKAYISELRYVGMLTDEAKPTQLALRWRLDETYSEAVAEIINNVYPKGLVDLAPPGEADRQKVVSWFQREGLGQGSAGNKAATYLLISSEAPSEAPKSSGKVSTQDGSGRVKSQRKVAAPPKGVPASPQDNGPNVAKNGPVKSPASTREIMPLNVNVQIHISADAGSEQIESIFIAMRRYLYDAQNS